MASYYVYIVTNKSRTIYTGMTNDQERRVYEHRNKLIRGFTSKYNITKLVWFEAFDDVMQAIEGEKKNQRHGCGSKKAALSEASKPQWDGTIWRRTDQGRRWDGPTQEGDPSVARGSLKDDSFTQLDRGPRGLRRRSGGSRGRRSGR